MGHRGIEHLQVVVEGVELARAVPHALFQVVIEPVYLDFGLRAHGNVTNVALNDLMAVFRMGVVDKLHVPARARVGLERQVFVPDIASASSRLKSGVADFGACGEASDDKEVSHAQEVRCTALG